MQSKIQGLKGKKGVTLIPEWGESKIPVYVICEGKGIEIIQPLDKKKKRQSYSHSEAKEPFINQIIKLDHTAYTVVMLVRPSGAEYMDQYVKLCEDFGYSIGRDPLEEDVEVSFSLGGDF